MKGDFILACLFLLAISIFLKPLNEGAKKLIPLPAEEKIYEPHGPTVKEVFPVQIEIRKDSLSEEYLPQT